MSLSELKELFAEIGDYLYHRYLCLDLSRYNNFSLGATNTLIPKIVICFIIGAMIATVLMYLEKTQSSKLISALLHAECKDEESAKSAAELDVHMTRSLIRRLRKPSPLSKLIFYRGQKAPVSASFLLEEVKKANEIAQESTENLDNMVENGNSDKSYYQSRAEMLRERKAVDFTTVPLYIPSALTYRADVRYSEKPRALFLVLSLIALPILGIVVLRALPTVLLLADGMITFFQ